MTVSLKITDPALRTSSRSFEEGGLRDLLGRPLCDLRISVIDRCNFRCTYCMPEEEYKKHYTFVKKEDWLRYEEITRLAGIFMTLGVCKIRLTGGEPLLRPHLPVLIKSLKSLGGINDVAMTTNGSFLAEYAKALKESGLNRITISLDTLDAKLFRQMNGGKGRLRQVLEGIRTTEEAGFDCIKINVVVQRGINDEHILDMVEYFKGRKAILRFIEYMDAGNCNRWDPQRVLPSSEVVKIINERFPIVPAKPHYYGEVASRYVFRDGTGEVGFIPSVTQPFCRTCTRARLSTDGKMYMCLFAGDGLDLKRPLREGASDEELLRIVGMQWKNRMDRYSELRSQTDSPQGAAPKVEMFQIGG